MRSGFLAVICCAHLSLYADVRDLGNLSNLYNQRSLCNLCSLDTVWSLYA